MERTSIKIPFDLSKVLLCRNLIRDCGASKYLIKCVWCIMQRIENEGYINKKTTYIIFHLVSNDDLVENSYLLFVDKETKICHYSLEIELDYCLDRPLFVFKHPGEGTDPYRSLICGRDLGKVIDLINVKGQNVEKN